MAKDTFLYRKSTVNVKGKLIDLSMPSVMGILNITPDSFHKNSRISNVDEAVIKAEAFLKEGAKFIDIGGYSSRPGAVDVTEDEELDRLLPIVTAISSKLPEAIISIDTFRARVARETIAHGAHIINDISAGSLDEAMFETIAQLSVPYIIMHMRGNPQNMQQMTDYTNLTMDVVNYFSAKLAQIGKLGIKDVIIDPGFGFAKTLDHNYELLQRLEDLHIFGLPILVGVSRKGMIYKLLETNEQEALNGTSVINTIALLKGASILRVHDVKEAKECITLVQKMQQHYSD